MFEVFTIVAVLAVLINLIERPLRESRQPVRSMALAVAGCCCLATGLLAAGNLIVGSLDSLQLPIAAAQEAAVQKTDSTTADSTTADTGGSSGAETSEDAPADQATDADAPVQIEKDTDDTQPTISEPILVERPASSDTDEGQPVSRTGSDLVLKRPNVEIPYAERPEWVGQPLSFDGDVHSMAIVAGPTFHMHECKRALDEEKERAVAQYINEFIGNPHASKLIGYDLAYINEHLVNQENMYDEVVTVSFGPMHQMHAKLDFDKSFQNDVTEQWRQVKAASRLAQTGVGVGSVLALLALVLSYFKLDTRTRGFYTGRLQFLAALAVLGVLAVGAVAFKWWIPWI